MYYLDPVFALINYKLQILGFEKNIKFNVLSLIITNNKLNIFILHIVLLLI